MEKGRDVELKGNKALDYLLPKFEKLNLNASMADSEIINPLLAAFNWEGSWEKIEVKIQFLDGTKLDLEKKLDD